MRFIFILGLFFCFSRLFSQEVVYQESITRELNSGNKALKDVYIKFQSSSSTTSDDNGFIKLAFQNKKAGDLIFLEDIRKRGYELVNKKDFEITKISNTSKLELDFILAPEGVVDEARKAYYNISDKALREGFTREKNVLIARLKEAQISQAEYQEKFYALQESYDRQREKLETLADKFARVNFDDEEVFYERALNLFKAGKIDQAIEVLEKANPAERTAKIIQEEKRINKAQEELDSQRSALKIEKQKHISAIKLLADMYSLTFDPTKAELQYDQLVLLDSTDIEILLSAANFYREQHRYEKALGLYPKLISHPSVDPWKKANSLSYMGELFRQTGELDSALKYFYGFRSQYAYLCKIQPYAPYNWNNLSNSYERLGAIYSSMGEMDSALYLFRVRARLGRKLHASYPYDPIYLNALAIACQYLGTTFSSIGESDSSLHYFIRFVSLQRKLNRRIPGNMKYQNNLTIAFNQLGVSYSEEGELDSSLHYFNLSRNLNEKLYQEFPQNVDFKSSLVNSYFNLAEDYNKGGNTDTAMKISRLSIQLAKEICDSFPQNVEFKGNLAYSYEVQGKIFKSLGEMDSALLRFKKSNLLIKALFRDYPKNTEYKSALASSYQKIGELFSFMRKPDSAFKYYYKDLELSQSILNDYPDNAEFKNSLALSYQYLGYAFATIGEADSSLRYIKVYHDLENDLSKSYPQNIQYKNRLATACVQLAILLKDGKGNYQEAERYSRRALKIWDELLVTHPSFVELKGHYQTALNQLEELENISIQLIEAKILEESDTSRIYQLYTELSDTLRIKAEIDQKYKPQLANALNSKAWYALLLSRFKQAEKAIREGLQLGTDNKYLLTNLPTALLFQGKTKEATGIYWALKNKIFETEDNISYKKVFLDDLEIFEKKGIIPKKYLKDVESVKEILEK